MSKARQAAEERYPLNGDATNIAIRATLQTGYVAGRLDALPEVPDPAVIEAIKRALFSTEEIDGADAAWHNYWEGAARAAYAAMRGAMQ